MRVLARADAVPQVVAPPAVRARRRVLEREAAAVLVARVPREALAVLLGDEHRQVVPGLAREGVPLALGVDPALRRLRVGAGHLLQRGVLRGGEGRGGGEEGEQGEEGLDAHFCDWFVGWFGWSRGSWVL